MLCCELYSTIPLLTYSNHIYIYIYIYLPCFLSFNHVIKKVNLQPSTRVSFQCWCERIKEKLQTGVSFVVPDVASDLYQLLPAWWQVMPPIEKRAAFDIVEFHDGFTVDCIHSLKNKCSIALNKLQQFRVCYKNARID